jgi:hypothetical protein
MDLVWIRKHAENTTDCNVKTVFCYKQIYIYKKQDKRHRKHAMVTKWSLERNFLYCAQRKTEVFLERVIANRFIILITASAFQIPATG